MNLDALLQRVAAGLGETVDPRTADEADAHVIKLATRLQSREEQRRRQDQFDALEAEKAWYRLGIVLEERGELEEAAGWMRKAAEVSYGDATCRLSRLLSRLGQTAEAHQWHAIAVEAGLYDPDDADHPEAEPLQQPSSARSGGGHVTREQEAEASQLHQDPDAGVDVLLQTDDEAFYLEAKGDRSLLESRFGSFLRSTLIKPAADLDILSIIEESMLVMVTRWSSLRDPDLYVPIDFARRSSSGWHNLDWVDVQPRPILITLPTGVGKTNTGLQLFKALAQSHWPDDASLPMTMHLYQTMQAHQFDRVCSRVLLQKIRAYDEGILEPSHHAGSVERRARAWSRRLLDARVSPTRCAFAMSQHFSAAIPSQRKQRVRDAMLLWDKVVVLHEDATVDAALAAALEQQVRRLPVVDEHGQVTGLIYLDDLAAELYTHRGTPSIARIDSLKRPPTFVSPDMTVDDVLEAMLRSGVHIAVVVEGDRQPIGLVTLTQLLQPPRDHQKRPIEAPPSRLQVPHPPERSERARRLGHAVDTEPVDRSPTRSVR